MSNLEIVHQFQKVGFNAEIYHYTPSQPGSKNSKWIIFLYHSGGNAPATQIVEQKTLTDNISLYPNPTNADIQTLSFLTDKVEEVQIDLYDMSGRRIMKVFEGKSMVGNNKHSVDLTNIASGVYLYKIYIGKQTAHIKTIKP